MRLTPAQIQIASCPSRFRVVCCGRRFGKTTEAVEEIKAKALSKPSRICYIAPTYQQARDIAWEQLRRELNPIIKTINESRLELKVKNNYGESLIILRGWESIETLRGQQYDLIIIDEVASMRNFLLNWQEVIRPTLTDTKGEVLFISTPKGFNHFYDLYNQQDKDKDYKSFHFTSYDNPHIPQEELDKAKLELTEDRFSQEYLADFRKTEGLVYKEFNREKHIFTDEKDIINPSAYFGGIDFGFTHPTAVISIKKDYDSRFWVTREYYKTGKTDEEVADYVAGVGFNYVYPDPENAAAIEVLRRKGINIREVSKGKDSVRNGINVVRELFKQNRLFIHVSCINLIFELETYSYPDKKDSPNSPEIPIKETDDAVDALRYALMTSSEAIKTSASAYYPKLRPIIRDDSKKLPLVI